MEGKLPRGADHSSRNNGTRSSGTEINRQPAAARTLLDDDMSEDDTDNDQSNGVSLNAKAGVAAKPVLRVNEEYARRFEHNKKREELHRRKFSKIITFQATVLTPMVVL